jgi:DNA-directed RNA polymerase specialized sigma24 family protein
VSDRAELSGLLVQFHGEMLDFVRRHAGRLLRYESEDDLMQEVHVRALQQGERYRHHGREPFLAWIHTVARSVLADRHAHWAALRRRPAGLLRLTIGGTESGGIDPALSATGPSTFAARREMLAFAVKALSLLPKADRDLVQWRSEDVPLGEQASKLGLSYAALDSASRRAIERYRKSFRLLTGR